MATDEATMTDRPPPDDGAEDACASAERRCARVLEKIATCDAKLNAFSGVLADSARREARTLDRQRRPHPPLEGAAVAVKDNIDTVPAVCSAGLDLYRDYRPARDAKRRDPAPPVRRARGRDHENRCRSVRRHRAGRPESGVPGLHCGRFERGGRPPPSLPGPLRRGHRDGHRRIGPHSGRLLRRVRIQAHPCQCFAGRRAAAREVLRPCRAAGALRRRARVRDERHFAFVQVPTGGVAQDGHGRHPETGNPGSRAGRPARPGRLRIGFPPNVDVQDRHVPVVRFLQRSASRADASRSGRSLPGRPRKETFRCCPPLPGTASNAAGACPTGSAPAWRRSGTISWPGSTVCSTRSTTCFCRRCRSRRRRGGSRHVRLGSTDTDILNALIRYTAPFNQTGHPALAFPWQHGRPGRSRQSSAGRVSRRRPPPSVSLERDRSGGPDGNAGAAHKHDRSGRDVAPGIDRCGTAGRRMRVLPERRSRAVCGVSDEPLAQGAPGRCRTSRRRFPGDGD